MQTQRIQVPDIQLDGNQKLELVSLLTMMTMKTNQLVPPPTRLLVRIRSIHLTLLGNYSSNSILVSGRTTGKPETDESDSESTYSGLADACCDGDENGKFICKALMWACGLGFSIFILYALCATFGS